MVRTLASILLVSGLVAGTALADPPTPTLASRLDTVAASPFASAAAGTVEQARGALDRAESLRAEGDAAAAARAEAIARAAVHLAERQVARAAEHTERESVAHRLVELRQRLETALEALAQMVATGSDASDAAAAAVEAAGDDVEDEE